MFDLSLIFQYSLVPLLISFRFSLYKIFLLQSHLPLYKNLVYLPQNNREMILQLVPLPAQF